MTCRPTSLLDPQAFIIFSVKKVWPKAPLFSSLLKTSGLFLLLTFHDCPTGRQHCSYHPHRGSLPPFFTFLHETGRPNFGSRFFHPAFRHRATISLMSRERPRARDTCLYFPYTIPYPARSKTLHLFFALPRHDTNSRRREPEPVSRETSRSLQPRSLPFCDA